MRLRKLILLGALVAFVGGISSCSKKTDNATTDTTMVPPAPPAAAPAPPPPPPMDSSSMTKKDTAVAMKAAGKMKTEGKNEEKSKK